MSEQKTTRWYRVTGKFFVGVIGTDDDGIITSASPVMHKFRGKRLFQLHRWRQVVKIERVPKEVGDEQRSP